MKTNALAWMGMSLAQTFCALCMLANGNPNFAITTLAMSGLAFALAAVLS